MKRFLALFAVTSVLVPAAWVFRADLARFAYLGPPLMRVETPADALEVPVGAVDVLIEFPDGERVAVETFECLLNGQNVTDSLTVGKNGAAGEVVGLREGDNRIRLRVFGRSFWNDHFVDEERDFVVRVRELPFLDLA
ncbi:MAG: hypothetical protein ACHQ6T_14645 [Myxococcota bacterium]